MQKIQRNFGRFGVDYCYYFIMLMALLLAYPSHFLELWNFQLDDTIVKSIETAPNDELKKAKEIIQRIRRRELYKVAVLSVGILFYYFVSPFLSCFSHLLC